MLLEPLAPSGTRRSSFERELLSIVWSGKHFKPYPYGRKFKLATDHRPLTWLEDPGSRLARWRFNLNITVK